MVDRPAVAFPEVLNPLWKPAWSINQAAEVLTPGVPSGRTASKRGASSGRRAACSAVRIGFMKKLPQL